MGSRGEYLVGSLVPCPRLEARELELETLEGLRVMEGRLELRLLLRCRPDLGFLSVSGFSRLSGASSEPSWVSSDTTWRNCLLTYQGLIFSVSL